jgi:hypothetical protein
MPRENFLQKFLLLGMHSLNFPHYTFRFKNSENKIAVFDRLRKKFVLLTPEEWVRQHVVEFLLQEKKYPQSLLNAEKQIKIHDLTKRYDLLAYRPDGSIHLIVECKAATVPITQATFDQIARYNLALNATYLMVTNGLEHYFCQLDYEAQKYHFLPDLPLWESVTDY